MARRTLELDLHHDPTAADGDTASRASRIVITRLSICTAAALFLPGCAPVGDASSSHGSDDAIAGLVEDVCDAQIVFLGEEPSHGGGQAVRVKSAVVRGLIQSCGFDHLAFESQIYDFVDLQEKYADGTASREALYDAIGGLWSRAAEIDPLVELLHESARADRITVSGFDINVIGATAHYSQTQLAERLSRGLPPDRQKLCSDTIGRLTGWKFDGAHPKDAAFDETVLGCARDIEAASIAATGIDSTQAVLARSFRAFLEFSQNPSGALRDSMMYQNLEWTLGRLPRATKTIVWTATNHSLRNPLRSREPMASHAAADLGAGVRSIAFVALSGAITRGGRRQELVSADRDSLEAQFAPIDGAQTSYIDGEQLRRSGTKKSRVLGYSEYVEETWSSYLDGIVVMAAEAPQTYVRDARPMQRSHAEP